MTEFSKTFPVFYTWPDLTDVQVVLTGTVPVTLIYVKIGSLPDLSVSTIEDLNTKPPPYDF